MPEIKPRNLLEGIQLPATEDEIAATVDRIRARLTDHAALFEIEQSAPIAMLKAIQQMCRHPNATRLHDRVYGTWTHCGACGYVEDRGPPKR